MKKKLISPKGLKPQGIGPQIIRLGLPFLIAGTIVQIYWPNFVKLSEYNFPFVWISGFLMILIGAIAYAIAIIQLLKNFSKGNLIKHGIFSISRNPIYASWNLLIFPGLAFLCNNWLFLLGAFAMNGMFYISIKKEESQLEAAFGDEFETYKKEVPRLI